MSARASHSYGELSRRFSRCCKISYKIADAAALTLSESIAPRSGSAINWSQALATRGRRPAAPAVAPAAGAARVGEEVGDVAHARDAQMLDGAGRRLARGRRDLGGAALGDHDAGRGDALGGGGGRAG